MDNRIRNSDARSPRISLRRWVHSLSLAACLAVGTAIAVIGVVSYWQPVEWVHLPRAQANWLIEFRMVGGAFYMGTSRYGIGYVPWFIPVFVVSVWPLIAIGLFLMKRRRGERRFAVAA